MLQESFVEYAFGKLRLLNDVYKGMNDAAILQKVKTKMDTRANLWIKVKFNITDFIQKCKDLAVYNARWPQNVCLVTARPQCQNT